MYDETNDCYIVNYKLYNRNEIPFNEEELLNQLNDFLPRSEHINGICTNYIEHIGNQVYKIYLIPMNKDDMTEEELEEFDINSIDNEFDVDLCEGYIALFKKINISSATNTNTTNNIITQMNINDSTSTSTSTSVPILNEYVLLQCQKEHSKLKIKMLSSNPFIKGLNVQFPRSIRQEGMYYIVRSNDIKLMSNFYSMRKEENIVCRTYDMNEVKKYVSDLVNTKNIKLAPLKIFGDDDETECIICLSNPKSMVIYPCGHYSCCQYCIKEINTCPLCRTKIINSITRSQLS